MLAKVRLVLLAATSSGTINLLWGHGTLISCGLLKARMSSREIIVAAVASVCYNLNKHAVSDCFKLE
jgi:hypothetical protein